MTDEKQKNITIKISDTDFAESLAIEVREAITRVLAADGILGNDIRDRIVNAAVDKLTNYDGSKRFLEDIIKKYLIDKAVQFLIRDDKDFERKYEAHAKLYEKEVGITDSLKIGLYFEYMIEKLVRGEVEARLRNMEISLKKHASPPAPAIPKPIGKPVAKT